MKNMQKKMLAWNGLENFIIVLFSLAVTKGVSQTTQLASALDSGEGSPNADEVFTVQPEVLTYVTIKKSGRLTCSAINAEDIHIRCNKVYITDSQISRTSTSVNGQQILTVETDINRSMVFEWLQSYKCECIALMDHGNQEVASRKGEFRIATLDSRFPQLPFEVSVEANKEAELMCRPPNGDPTPSVYWEKNGVRISDEPTDNYIVSNDGSLIIIQATSRDEGNYTCVAYNLFFKKFSSPASLHVFTNGGWSAWSPFGECDAKCGNGLQHRTRTCNNPVPSGRDARDCEGPFTQSSPCAKECPSVDGAWSEWGPWSSCEQCQIYRTRKCDNPARSGTGRPCFGLDNQIANCSKELCTGHAAAENIENPAAGESQNIILWVVLCAAVAVLAIILVIIIMCLMKKRNRRHDAYSQESPELSDDGTREEKKLSHSKSSSSVQTDLPKTTLPLRNHRSYNQTHLESPASPLEKTPMLSPNQYHAKDYYMQISANESCDHHDYMQIGGRDSENEGTGDKTSQISSGPESGICNSCDRQSIMSNQLPPSIETDALAWGNMTHTGGRLSVVDSDISITVPEGAIGRNQTEEIFISSMREDKDRPVLLEKQTLLSAVVLCGPHGTTFNKSLILSFDHCASIKLSQWKLSIYSSNSGYNEPPQWERLMTLHQEILHTPVFCQLDNNRCHVMVDQLASRYCLVGESMYGSKAVKLLKLAAFAQPFTSAMECNVRVYVLPDTQDALCNIVHQESKLGAKLMDKPKQIAFQDGGNNLCLMLDSISGGWISKIPAQYQEIPFRHVWSPPSNLHCSFAFERQQNQSPKGLSCKIQVYQKSVLSNRQQININSNLETSFKVIGQKDLSSTVTVNTQSSSGCSSMVVLDNREQQVFKLPTAIKKKLASHLDTPCTRGNDWRMLASALSSDRHLNFFSSKPSPTEAILDLWEARNNNEESPVVELANILRAMGRQEAAVILERELDNAWV